MFYLHEALKLKLPHNPLFHAYKSLLDLLKAYNATPAELQRQESPTNHSG